MRDYQRLEVWRKSHALCLAVYRATGDFPVDERFGLTQQIRRAAVSIPSNIAEGAGRETRADYRRFLSIASGSVNELDFQITLSQDLGYIPDSIASELTMRARELRRMLEGLKSALTRENDP